MESKINMLDEITINKIAAGEVVDKPASVVKELVENSIDARAKQIFVEIESGGKKMIKVSDDGHGMFPEDIPKAFTRHATSKIKVIEDISKLNTNGFRGEALSSIASVSEVEIITNTSNEHSGKRAFLKDSKVIELQNYGVRKGTTIIIRNLFDNIPARKKFLKNDIKEASLIADIVSKLAIINPEIRFKLISDGKTIISTDGDGSLLSSTKNIYGKSLGNNLVKVSYFDNSVEINGYISNTSLYVSNRKKQTIYINKRYVKVANLTHIIESAYKELIPIGKYPVYVLDICVLPEKIDPNVHPSKIEVKIDSSLNLENIIHKLIKCTLLESSTNMIPQFNSIKKDTSIDEKTLFFTNIDKFKSPFVYEDDSESQKHEEIIKKNIVCDPEVKNLSFSKILNLMSESKSENNINQYSVEKTLNESEVEKKGILDYREFHIIGTIFSTYIIACLDSEMYMIDQHAAHERVNYDNFITRYSLNSKINKRMDSQEVLVPISKELTIEEYAIVIENLDLFDSFGIDISDIGYGRIIIRSFPVIFNEILGIEFFEALLESIIDEKKIDFNDTFRNKLASIACKKSIKANQSIRNIEVSELLNLLNDCENKYTCPHGRPIFIKFSKYEIEKMFKRV